MGIRSVLGGAGLALLGILIVEGLLAAGLRPLSPLGWPGGGMLVGAAMYGPAGALGGALVGGAYGLVQATMPARFPMFFGSPAVIAGWIVTLTGLALMLMTMRRRLMRELVSAQVLRDAQAELQLAKQRLELGLEGSGTALWDTNLATREVVLSAAWSEMLGGPAAEARTTVEELMALIHPDDLEPAVRASMEAVRGTAPVYSVEHRVRAPDGRWLWIISRGRVIERDPKTGRAVRMVGTNIDITARRQAEQRMKDLAQHDSLTGLANRALFLDRLRRAASRLRRAAGAPALVYLDVDRFKHVNDTLGHAAGDALLREFAARVAGCLREADTVGRLGGDEFVVLLEDVREAQNVGHVVDKILAAVREPMQLEGQPLRVTASAGIAVLREAETAEHWMKRADEALYEAKAAGRDTVRAAA